MATAKKTALVMGVANRRSIAWACVRSLLNRNYDVVCTYRNERLKMAVEGLIEKEKNEFSSSSSTLTNQSPSVRALPCRIDSSEVPLLFQELLPELLGEGVGLDAIVHSIAYAPSDAMKGGSLLQTSREAFAMAHDISSYSLLEVARCAMPIMNPESSSITTLSYLGARRAIPNYNVMGPAKASLEAVVRGLALELGPNNVRVNVVSAGPLNTLAARGIAGFSDIRHDVQQRAPLRRNVTADEVAETVAFLATGESHGITGQTICVDAGYGTVAGPVSAEEETS